MVLIGVAVCHSNEVKGKNSPQLKCVRLTTRGVIHAHSSILTRLLLAHVRIKNTSQLDLGQSHHFCVLGAFVVQRKLIVVYDD